MKNLISVKLSPHKSKTPEGYLICYDAILARTGKQDYYSDELFGDGSNEIISVDRPLKEVSDPKTLASFENKPITIEHPDENVGPDNYKQLAVGEVRDVRMGKDNGIDVMLGNLIIKDAEAIDLIESGKMTELSCGYDCDITDGENPSQINIRGNHIAICAQGRAGNTRIIDSYTKNVPTAYKFSYRGYMINFDEAKSKPYSVMAFNQNNVFYTEQEAKLFIDDIIDTAKSMLRDKEIAKNVIKNPFVDVSINPIQYLGCFDDDLQLKIDNENKTFSTGKFDNKLEKYQLRSRKELQKIIYDLKNNGYQEQTTTLYDVDEDRETKFNQKLKAILKEKITDLEKNNSKVNSDYQEDFDNQKDEIIDLLHKQLKKIK